ncbi:flagellin N-terminal helical domain-containing protein [Roseomonas marmotae]|uniref:Flagellin n=1 Tax=Roseomonas marmotae TaxID=2768161 RepID=A0ABS3KF85_9PROT|nr:flagellin [Roseomonas marmotae]MBO1076138.1 flagellin [Roseomonas marmotae]QTI81271.1 flagellin [Roseomonas marmotae]
MASSILTNNGALTALQSLKATQKSLLTTQNRISTGLKVASAKDNAATWAVATAMRSDIANTKQVSENLSVSSAIVATAQTAAEKINDIVKEIRTKVTSAQNPAVDKAQVQADIDGYVDNINSIVAAATFKGVNLINEDGTQRVLTSVNTVNGVSTGDYADLSKQNLKVEEGSMLSSLKNLTVLSRADQTLANQNDGVQKLTYSVGATLALKTGNEVAVDYVDAKGANRSLTVKLTKDISTIDDLMTFMNADAGFKDKFTAERVSGTNTFTISTKNRDSTLRLGSVSNDVYSTSNSLKVEMGVGAAVGSATLGLGTSDLDLDAGVRRLDMTFADKPLQLGDEFVVQVQTSATDADSAHTYKLKVVDNGMATGDKIYDGTNVDENVYVIAVAAADVTNPNVTGKDIAEKLRDALVTGTGATKWNTGTAAFTNTAAPTGGTSFGASVDSMGKLSIVSGNGTDDVLSFNSSKTDYDVLLQKLDAAGTNAANAAAAFGTTATRIDLQRDFLDKLVDTLTTGLGALVDADMSEEAARLQALQVQEQLGTQALSIANQAPQSILRLFQ